MRDLWAAVGIDGLLLLLGTALLSAAGAMVHPALALAVPGASCVLTAAYIIRAQTPRRPDR